MLRLCTLSPTDNIHYNSIRSLDSFTLSNFPFTFDCITCRNPILYWIAFQSILKVTTRMLLQQTWVCVCVAAAVVHIACLKGWTAMLEKFALVFGFAAMDFLTRNFIRCWLICNNLSYHSQSERSWNWDLLARRFSLARALAHSMRST